jgi:cytidylate kinase
VIVAIDGPAGAGKSSVARAVASSLGFAYFDTGALYRAVSLAALERGVDVADDPALGRLARAVKVEMEDGRVLLDGTDVTARIRDRDVTDAVSAVSAVPGVRAGLAELQREAAAKGNLVIEGRDIGTEVVPDADLKVFLTASLEERARRRCRQLGVAPDPHVLEETRKSIAARDELDSTRAVSPLTQASDAVVVDSTEMALEEVVGHIVALVEGRRR